MNPSAGAAPTASASSPLRAWVLFGNSAIFVAACSVVCALLSRLSPFPDVPAIAPKWTWFQAHRDDFDVIFIGSSRLYHQIIPAQFDAAVTAAGGPKIRSFNFSYDGMWPPESFYLLRRILDSRPTRLKWVVIDLMDISMSRDEGNKSTMRMAYWHDARHTRLAFSDILATRRTWATRFAPLMEHAETWLREALNLGRGSELLNADLVPRPPRRKANTWEAAAGYEPGSEKPMTAEVRQKFSDAVAQLTPDRPKLLRPFVLRALGEVIADVRRAGAEPVFVIAPTPNPWENFAAVPDGAALLNFSDPAKYPALFDPTHHYDPYHLNPKGAVFFTAAFAARFAEIVRAGK